MMVFEPNDLLIVLISAYLLKSLHCSSLNSLKGGSIQRNGKGNITKSTDFETHVVENLIGKTADERVSQVDTTLKTIFNNPCLLYKIALDLDIDNLRIIVSRKQVASVKSLLTCRRVFAKHMRTSVAIIQDDENNIEVLKQNLLRLLKRKNKSYAVLCPIMCSNLVMILAKQLGFGSLIYKWITVVGPIRKDIRFPDKWVAATIAEKALENIETNASKSSNQIYNTELKNNICFEIHMVTSQNERASFGCSGYETSGSVGSSTDPYLYISNLRHKLPRFFERKTLNVVTFFREFAYERLQFLDHTDMTCRCGILCWLASKQHGEKRRPTCCLGFIMDILELLRNDLQVDLHVYEVEDGRSGKPVNGSWNGVIGEVISKKASMAAGFLTINEARVSSVDMSKSFLTTHMVIASKIQVSKLHPLNLKILASIINPEFWMMILGTTLFTSFIIYWSERVLCTESQRETWFQLFMYAVGLLTQRDIGGSVPRYLGSQTVSIVLALAMMIIMTTYVAVLASQNIISTEFVQISGLDDPKAKSPTSSFKIGTWRDSHTSHLFEKSNNPEWRRLGHFMKSYNFKELAEVNKRMRNGTLDAVIMSASTLTMLWNSYHDCDVQFEGTIVGSQAYAFAFPKDSDWNEPVSSLLHEYEEVGKLDDIQRKYLTSLCQKESQGVAAKFGLLYLSGACIMIVFGLILSTCVFILELILARRKSSYNPTNGVEGVQTSLN